jgi:hypothetical protein
VGTFFAEASRLFKVNYITSLTLGTLRANSQAT